MPYIELRGFCVTLPCGSLYAHTRGARRGSYYCPIFSGDDFGCAVYIQVAIHSRLSNCSIPLCTNTVMNFYAIYHAFKSDAFSECL